MPASDPVAAAASAARRSPSTSGSTDCVSGSPNRQLYSSTRGPSGVSMRPTNRVPTNGDPRLASSARTGRTVSSTIRATASSSISATGANEPIPPVLGPASPSYARLKSRAGASATASMPSHNANTETSGPSRSSSTRTSPSNPSAAASPARSSLLGATDDHALPGREAVGLQHARGARLREQCRRRHAGHGHHRLREPLRSLDARRCRGRAEHGDSGVPEDVRDAGDERRLGADDDEIDVERAREPQQPVGVVRGDRVTRRERRDAGAARRGMELVERRRGRQPPRERVLPTPRADEKDAHRARARAPRPAKRPSRRA